MTAEGLLMFGKKLHTPEYTLAGDEVAVIETSQGTIRAALGVRALPSTSLISSAFYYGFL